MFSSSNKIKLSGVLRAICSDVNAYPWSDVEVVLARDIGRRPLPALLGVDEVSRNASW